MKLLDLPIGSKVKFGKYSVETEPPEDIIWLIADKNHEGYPDDSSTLITEKIIDLRAFDAKEPNNPDVNRRNQGNNNYSLSNYRQWLNSDKEDWYIPQHEYDAPPTDDNTNYSTGYDSHLGFLYYFTKKEKNVILPTPIITAKNTVIDNGGSETIIDFIFPLSAEEVGLINENEVAEGSKLILFSDNNSRKAFVTQQCFDNTKSTSKPDTIDKEWRWWLRTPDFNSSYSVWNILSSGGSHSFSARMGANFGVRPACNIPLSTTVTETPDEDGCYKVILDKPKYCLYKRK